MPPGRELEEEAGLGQTWAGPGGPRSSTPHPMDDRADDLSHFLVGSCEVHAGFVERLGQVAASQATVLLTGESGSGKGRAARGLHRCGPRRTGPLVEVSLAALAPSLVEAELFGHAEGAFTGAVGAREGRFRQADGGTLVLDDVDTVPREAQGKLLRVIQERMVEPVGAEAPVPVDVRVVATTTTDLRSSVASGAFREDLYYRLAVIPIAVPPLRARLEDLPALVEHLVARLSGRLGLPPRPFEPAALERLRAHPWPGNVRELENALERVLVLHPGSLEPVEASELDFLAHVAADVGDDLARQALAHGLRLHELEGALLRAAASENRGNLSAAARQVGLTRRAFEYRLEKARAGDADPEGDADDPDGPA